jgi:hypothetical protein
MQSDLLYIEDELLNMGPVQKRVFLAAIFEDLKRRIAAAQ